MNIPPPPTWLLALAVGCGVFLFAHHSHGAPYYQGRPPPGGVRPPYHCFCQWHGPHGGCIKWVCPKKKSEGPGDPDNL
jgi:hypothetical protein